MSRPKLLITGGCSYSQIPALDKNWPYHLEQQLDPDYHIHTGKAAVGNEIISHRVIYKVNQAIEQGFNPEDILVGVAWSGCDRMALMTTNFDKMFEEGPIIGPPNKKDWIKKEYSSVQPDFFDRENSQWTDNKNTSSWYVANSPSWVASNQKKWHENSINGTSDTDWHTLNPHWTDEMTVKYFEDFVSPEYALIQTCEHILRTQWYLETHHIKYFMCTYDYDTFVYVGPLPTSPHYSEKSEGRTSLITKHVAFIDEHPEVNWLYKMIDRNYWLDIPDMQGIGGWVKKHCADLPYREVGDPHPSSDMHKRFTDQVILPFLLEKYNIS